MKLLKLFCCGCGCVGPCGCKFGSRCVVNRKGRDMVKLVAVWRMVVGMSQEDLWLVVGLV